MAGGRSDGRTVQSGEPPTPTRIFTIAALGHINADKAIMSKRRTNPELVPSIKYSGGEGLTPSH
jgi:hypothetical protein